MFGFIPARIKPAHLSNFQRGLFVLPKFKTYFDRFKILTFNKINTTYVLFYANLELIYFSKTGLKDFY